MINAGDGVGEHRRRRSSTSSRSSTPTRAPAASPAAAASLGGLRLTLLGDLKHGRTVHSLALLAARRRAAAPRRGPPPRDADEVTAALTEKGVAFDTHDSLAAALPQSDVLYVTRVQKERFPRRGVRRRPRRVRRRPEGPRLAPKDCIVMHPLPRVDEIATDVDADPRQVLSRWRTACTCAWPSSPSSSAPTSARSRRRGRGTGERAPRTV